MSQPIGISGGVEIRAEAVPVFAEFLTPDACRFSAGLSDRFEERRQNLLTARTIRQANISAGGPLNSGGVYAADLEDSNAPAWQNLIEGQINLRDAIRRQIEYSSPDGTLYARNDQTAALFVRPCGFGLFFLHNAAELLSRGSGPYFYLPKMESHLEARLWNDAFVFAQDWLGEMSDSAVRGNGDDIGICGVSKAPRIRLHQLEGKKP
jgi:malate synthase